jgi:hypothetical protein
VSLERVRIPLRPKVSGHRRETGEEHMRSDLFVFATFLAFVGCGTEEPGPLEVAGTWASNFGFDETISETSWGSATIVRYDNDDNFAVMQQPADDMFNPSKFSKVVWTEPMLDRFFYCTVDYGLATAAEAEASTKSADASDPANGGCGGFSWTRLAEPIEISGTFTSVWGMETISSHVWGTATMHEYDNRKNEAVTQFPEDDPYNPNKFNKVVWTEPSAGRFFYCIVDFGKETLEAAKTSTQSADASDPSASGCGGFSWTELSPN